MLVIDQFRTLLKRVDPALLSSADRRALLDLYEASTPAAQVAKQAGGGVSPLGRLEIASAHSARRRSSSSSSRSEYSTSGVRALTDASSL